MMNYHKKIVPYLDGSLAPEERSEFEAYVSTHPDFEGEIRKKQEELSVLKSLIPHMEASSETLASLETEVKSSIFNLLKSEQKTLWGTLKDRFEEWSNR